MMMSIDCSAGAVAPLGGTKRGQAGATEGDDESSKMVVDLSHIDDADEGSSSPAQKKARTGNSVFPSPQTQLRQSSYVYQREMCVFKAEISNAFLWRFNSASKDEENPRSGKWIATFFGRGGEEPEYVNEAWERSVVPLDNGLFGPSMKRTLCVPFIVGNSQLWSVLYYTKDHDDLVENLCVLRSLRGYVYPKMRLQYKTDARTFANEYSHNYTGGDLNMYHSPEVKGDNDSTRVEMHRNSVGKVKGKIVSDLCAIHLPWSSIMLGEDGSLRPMHAEDVPVGFVQGGGDASWGLGCCCSRDETGVSFYGPM